MKMDVLDKVQESREILECKESDVFTQEELYENGFRGPEDIKNRLKSGIKKEGISDQIIDMISMMVYYTGNCSKFFFKNLLLTDKFIKLKDEKEILEYIKSKVRPSEKIVPSEYAKKMGFEDLMNGSFFLYDDFGIAYELIKIKTERMVDECPMDGHVSELITSDEHPETTYILKRF